MTNKGCVSIVMASYNKGNYIADSINSVIAQSYSNWELIIVDDCSSDSTLDLVKDYVSKDSRIKLFVNRENKGGNFSRNRGLENACGDYVCFLDSDDILVDDCLASRKKFALTNPDYDVFVFPMGVFYKEIGDAKDSMYWSLSSVNPLSDFLMHQLPWAICQPMWKSDVLRSLGGFDLSFTRLQDVELHTRALLNGVKFKLAIESQEDCFYRIDESRSHLNTFGFCKNFTNGALQYYNKFYDLLSVDQRKLLGCTIIEVMSNVCYQRRVNGISSVEYNELVEMLIGACRDAKQIRLLKTYNLIEKRSPIHPKGLKKILLFLMRK